MTDDNRTALPDEDGESAPAAADRRTRGIHQWLWRVLIALGIVPHWIGVVERSTPRIH